MSHRVPWPCCRKAIEKHAQPEPKDNDLLDCSWCMNVLRFREGAWSVVDPSEPFYRNLQRDVKEMRAARLEALMKLVNREVAHHASEFRGTTKAS